jgi:hypothetical protein
MIWTTQRDLKTEQATQDAAHRIFLRDIEAFAWALLEDSFTSKGEPMAEDKGQEAIRIQNDPGSVDPRTTGPDKTVPVEFVMPKATAPEPEENQYEDSPPDLPTQAGQAHDRDSIPPGSTPAAVYAPPMGLKKDAKKEG